jgi:hypothetical protein
VQTPTHTVHCLFKKKKQMGARTEAFLLAAAFSEESERRDQAEGSCRTSATGTEMPKRPPVFTTAPTSSFAGAVKSCTAHAGSPPL